MAENGQTYLVTGAARGLGRELIRQLCNEKDATVIAAVRAIDSPQVESLRQEHPKVIVIKIDSQVNSDPLEAATKLTSMGISKIDTIIANAGLLINFNLAMEVKPSDLATLYQVNAIAPLVLYQAFKSLLDASTNAKFVAISSSAGSIARQASTPFAATSYGSSKAALNHITTRLAAENKNIITFAVQPGMVTTDMTSMGIKSFGMTLEEAIKKGITITPQGAAQKIIEKIHNATRESTSGTFIDTSKGETVLW